ncbi:alpha/beta hydrolase [bacterium]|nr:alpha/beta hydrolase [bacterium]
MIKNNFINVSGIKLHVVEAGPKDGPLVLLLHGFPEYWKCWDLQIKPLIDAGYRLIMPDQRGYNLSDKPKRIKDYCLDVLADDMAALIDHYGGKAAVICHDWGGAVGWFLANKYPEKISKFIVLNMSHHSVMKKFLQTNLKQLRRSWYIFFFQLPFLPELYLKSKNFLTLRKGLKVGMSDAAFKNLNLDEYIATWSEPGAIESILRWYRAAVQCPPKKLPSPRITMPSLVIWGKDDPYLGVEMAKPSADMCDHHQLIIIENAGHWVQRDQPEIVNREILKFLK